jgi:phosphodiesterase/alkaline phosphatase D-like protein
VTDSNGGIIYTLQISKDNTFASVLIEKKGLTSPSYTLDTKIPAEKLKSVSKNTPYYWRVRATDAASNTSAWTTPQTFLVGLALADYAVYIIMGAIAIMLGVLGFVLGRLTKRPY